MKTLSLLSCGVLALFPSLCPATPILSEIVAVGNQTQPDEDGNTPDWIEIHNPDATPLELGGYHLTDDPSDLIKWTFPTMTIAGDSHVVVFASDKDRAVAGSELHTNFKLASAGEYLALVAPDGSTIIDSFDPNFPQQSPGYSYGIGTGAVAGYFDAPTPGAANGAALAAPLLAPTVHPAGATFTTTVEITLSTDVPDGIMRYTTDGSEPIATSDEYSTALTFSNTTHLRTAVFEQVSGQRGAIGGEHFIRLGTSTAVGAGGVLGAPSEFTSDLPIMVIENFGVGNIPSPGSTLQTARLSLHDVNPTSGRSSLAAAPDATMRMGIRKRGQSSSGFSKPQYRVELRDELDEDLDYPLLGLPSDSDWVFNGPWTDKSLIRNPLAFGLGRRIGIEAPRTAHFELFLSTDSGDLTATEYVGVYFLAEKIKVGKDRVDIDSLDPADTTEPEVTGGYLMRFEPSGEASDGPRATGWTAVEILDPDTATVEQRDYMGTYLDEFAATLGWARGDGANDNGAVNPDPVSGYPAYIDVDSFVNLLVINELLRDQDSYVRSDYMFKDRGGKLHKGPLWDYNLIAGTGCCFDNRNPVGWQYLQGYNRGSRNSHQYEPDWFVPLMRDPDFRQEFTDRWFELRRDGALELDALFGFIDELANPLAESAPRNFARWDTLGDGSVGFPTPVTSTWEEQVDFIKTWLTTRTAWIDSEFIASPRLTPDGGVVAAESEVAVGSGESVYYTTDGSDPRLPGGDINPLALMLPASQGDVQVVFIDRNSEWRFLDDGSDLGASDIVEPHASYGSGNWKHPDFDDSSWASGDGIFGFVGKLAGATVTTAIYKGPFGGRVITYYFRKTFNVADASQVLALDCAMLRDDGAIIYLNGAEVARSNMDAGNQTYTDLAAGSVSGTGEATYFEISLDPADLVDGDNVIAVELHQDSSGSSDAGFDLELTGTVPATGTGFEIASTSQVIARARDGTGLWSAPSESFYVVGTAADASRIAVTELNYHPQDPSASEMAADPTFRDDDFEFIELKNISGGEIDLAGASFIEGIAFTFPAPTLLAPGAYLLVVENAAAFAERYGAGHPIAGVYANKMSNDGDTMRLVDLDGADIFHFTFNDIWHPTTDGLGPTLVATDEATLPGDYGAPTSWKPSEELGGSPGGPDGGVTYASWLRGQFAPPDLGNPAITGPDVDLIGNGFGTFLSYALGLSPHLLEPEKYPSPGIVDHAGEQFVSLTFRRQKDASDLIYRVLVSGDLVEWNETAELFASPLDQGDGTETVTFRDTVPISTSGNRFIKLQVEQN